MNLAWGREICGDLATAETREWLCTNGIGGFASGTVPGVLTRRYHGLLVAALKPPLGRTLLVAKVDEHPADRRNDLERRSRRPGLVTVVLCAMLSGCEQRIKSDLPAQMTAAGDLQRCRNQPTDERTAVSPVDFEGAMEARDTTGSGLCRFEVAVSDSPLRRDAFGRAPIVGHVVPGEELTFVDFIDCRLRILGHVVFDGGHWNPFRQPRRSFGDSPATPSR